VRSPDARARLAPAVAAGVLMACAPAAGGTVAGASRAQPAGGRAFAAVERLSSTPPVLLDGPVIASADFSSSTAAPRPSAAGPGPPAADPPHLPATGYDAATAALLGAGLLATALGLRRLTVDGRRF
jgi:hypothetical protein